MGLRPILKKAQWEGQDFAASSLEVPIGSGAYVVDQVEPGRSISFRRNPDYWGRDLPLMAGVNNFDVIRYDYFADANAMFEAFKAGAVTVWRELSAQKWASEYGFPLMTDGRAVQAEIPNERPSGIVGLVMNTRKPGLRRLARAAGADRDVQLPLHQPDPERRCRSPDHVLFLELGPGDAGRARDGARGGTAGALRGRPAARHAGRLYPARRIGPRDGPRRCPPRDGADGRGRLDGSGRPAEERAGPALRLRDPAEPERHRDAQRVRGSADREHLCRGAAPPGDHPRASLCWIPRSTSNARTTISST